MTIRIDDNIIGVWFVQLGDTEDYMMGMSRVPTGIEFTYRVRHYHPESKDAFDDKDGKSWATFGTNDPDEAKAISAAREMAKGLVGLSIGLGKMKPPGKVYELLRGEASVEEFAKRLMAAPFAHSQMHQLQ